MLDIQPTLKKLTYFQYHLISTAVAEKPFYNLTPKNSNDQSFFINGNENWKVLSLFLELENFTLVLLIEVLGGLILALLLDGHVQIVKS